jgi:hypothetical protein
MGMNRGAKIVSDGLIFCVDAASKRSYDGGDPFNDLSAFGSAQEGELEMVQLLVMRMVDV